MTVDELLHSAAHDAEPPSGLSKELLALWHTKADNWASAHNIAQDIHTPLGSWIHALLHLIEGDVSNAEYWFRSAGKPPCHASNIDTLWRQIAGELLA